MKTNRLVIILLIFTTSVIWAQIANKIRNLANRNASVISEVYEPANNLRSVSVNLIGQGNTSSETLVQNLSGAGISTSNVVFTGRNVAGATFSGAGDCGLDFDSGIILSSGAASNIIGPNNNASKSSNNQQAGDADLDIIAGDLTFDAAVLEFDFVPQYDKISLDFVLASEEYPEMIDYADVMAIWVDGVNIALIPGSSTPVSIGTINHVLNSELYVDNSPDNNNYSAPYTAPYDLQADGFTRSLRALANVSPGTEHHIKIAIADIADNVYDSWLILKEESFISAADLVTDYSVPANPYPGVEYDLTISVENRGPVSAQSVVVDFRLPFGATFVSAPGNVSMNGDIGIIEWASIASGASASVVIQVTSEVDMEWGEAVAIASSNTLEANESDNRSIPWQAPFAMSKTYDATEDQILEIDWQNGLFFQSSFSGLEFPTIEIIQQPTSGNLVIGDKGAFTISPSPDFFGMLSFSYILHDGQYSSPEASVVLDVANVYDPITINLESDYFITEDSYLNLLYEDIISNPDSAPLAVSVQDFAQGTWQAGESALRLTPITNWYGSSPFTVHVYDGSQNYQESSFLHASPVQDLSLEPALMDFGSVALGESATLRLLIHNLGNQIVQQQPPYISIDNPVFSIVTMPVTLITPHSSAYCDVMFSPVEITDYTATLSVTTDVFGESPISVPLLGSTLSLPEIAVEPEELNLSWASGNSYQAEIDISNTGATDLDYQASIIQGPPWLNLESSNGTIAPDMAAGLIITADLDMVAAAQYSATLLIQSNAGNNPAVEIPIQISVSGIPDIVLAQDPINFGTQYTGQFHTRVLAIQNTGSDVLEISFRTSNAAYAVEIQHMQIPAFSQENLNVSLFGANSGNYEAELQIVSNDPDIPQITIPLQATLIMPPTLSLSESEITIFSIGENFSGTQLQISNDGEENLSWTVDLEDMGYSTGWLDLNPEGGNLTPGASQTISLSCIPTGLAPGMHQLNLIFASNDIYRPNLPLNLKYIKQAYHICNYDNTDNANSGVPDMDMGVPIVHNSPKAPIEFVIYNNIPSVESAKLVINASDLDSYENCPVYLNDHSLGVLMDEYTVFQLDPTWLSSQNLVRIEIDTHEQGDGVQINMGQLVLNSIALDAAIRYIILDKYTYIAGEDISAQIEIDSQLANQEVLVHSSIADAQGNKLQTLNRTLILNANSDDSFTENLILPESLASGFYHVLCEVYDLETGLLQDSHDAQFEVLPNQARISLSASEIDFGIIPAGLPSSASIAVQNTGNMPLQISEISSPFAGLSLDPPLATINAGAEQIFEITLQSSELGELDTTFNFYSNDPQNPAAEVAISARLIANIPYISVYPHYLDFSTCFIGDSSTLQLEISNLGPQPLEITDVLLPHADFNCVPQSASLEYLESSIFSISFSPLSEGDFSGSINILSNADNQPEMEIPVYASAGYPPQIEISPAVLNANAESGASAELALMISNSGGSELKWALDENLGKALKLKGYSIATPQYARIPNRGEIQLANGSFSIFSWFRVDSNLGGSSSGNPSTGGKQFIFSKSSSANDGYIGLYCEGVANSVNGKKLVLQARNSSSVKNLITENCIFLNEWNHIAIVYSDNQAHLYLNAELLGSLDLPGFIGNTDPWILGKYNPTSSRHYLLEGALDEFVIFREAKSIEYLKQRMFTRFNPYEQSLSGYWNWDAGTGADTSIYHTMANLIGSPSFIDSAISQTPAWIQIDPAWADAQAGTGQSVTLNLSAANFLAGEYNAILNLRSNDFTDPLLTVPLTFVVSGDAGISLSSSSIDFDQVIINTTESIGLSITNNGSAELEISDISSDNAAFTTAVTDILIQPGESYQLQISFSPIAVEEYNATLSFETNAPDLPQMLIPLSGLGALPPLMEYSPASFAIALNYGDIQDMPVNISNSQGLPLRYHAELIETSRSNVDGIYPGLETESRGICWHKGKLYFIRQGSNLLKRYDPITQTIDAEYAIHNNAYSITSDGDNLYIGSSTGRIYKYNSNHVMESSFQPSLVNFAATLCYANSSIYVMDVNGANKPIYKFSPAGALQAQYSGTLSRSSQIIHVPEHTGAPFYALQSGLQRLVSFSIGSSGIQVADTLSLNMASCYSLAHNGRDLYILQNDLDYAQRVEDGYSEFNWLSMQNPDGSVSAGNSDQLLLSFSALNTFAGSYNALLKIHTNDPQNSVVDIPVSMQVSGIAQFCAEPQAIDFGNCYLGYPETETLRIENNGSAYLELVDISCTAGFSPSQTTLSIPPWQATDLQVTYSPGELGEDTGILSMQSNDPQVPQPEISLAGTCLQAPGIVLNPMQIESSLMNDATAQIPVQIHNTGISNLDFRIQISDSAQRDGTIRLPGENLGTIPFAEQISGAIVLNNKLYGVRNSQADLVCYDLADSQLEATYLIHDLPYAIAWDGSSFVIGGEGGILYYYHPEDLRTDERSTPFKTFATGIRGLPAFTFDNSDLIVAQAFASSPTPLRIFDSTGILASVQTLNKGGISALYKIPQFYSVGIYAYQNVIVDEEPAGGKILTLRRNAQSFSIMDEIDAWDGTISYTLCHDGNDFLYSGYAGPIQRIDDGVWLGSTLFTGSLGEMESTEMPLKLAPNGIDGGSYNAFVNVSSNDPASPVLTLPVSLQLSGYPALQITPAQAMLDSTLIGNTRILTLMLFNPGSDLLQVNSISSSNPDFSVIPESLELLPHTNSSLELSFSPSQPGEISTTLSFSTNITDSPVISYEVLGYGKTPAPELVVVPTSHNFGSVYTNASQSKNVRLRNTGTATLIIDSYSCAEDVFNTTAQFPLTIAAGDSMLMTIRFSPTSAQHYAAEFSLNSNIGAPRHIELSGTGLTPLPHLELTPAALNLGNPVVTVAKHYQFKISNTGQLPLQINSIISSDPHLQIGDFPSSISLATFVLVDLTYIASTSGPINGEIIIQSNDPDNPSQALPFSGTAIIGNAILDPSPQNVIFPLTLVGAVATQNISISNTGNLPLKISSIGFSHSAYSSPTDSLEIAPQSSAEIPIEFAPTEPGSTQAIMLIRNNSQTANYQISLQGSAEHHIHYSLNPEYLDISSMQEEIVTTAINLSNPSNGNLSWNVSCDAPWLQLSPVSGNLSADTNMDIQVQVSTMDLLYGQYDAQIMLFSNSQSQSTRSIPVYLNYSEFGYTSLDNEDNQGSGNPDGDMDVLIGSSSSLAPIEFNIFLDEAEIYNAQLELLAQSVLPGHEHKVYVNNYLVGYLSAPTATMQNSYFNLDPTMLNSAPQIPNTVRIVPDALHYDSNGIMIMWGNITCNRDFSNASITELSYLPLMPVPGSQLSLKQYVQTNLNAQSVRVSSKLFNSAQEQVLNTQTRMMNLLAYQPSFTTVIWNLADIDPGSYYALVEVFDSNSNTLQDQMQLPIMILADEPMISPALQSLDFADVYPGYEYTLPLPISNLGAAELEVSSLSFSNPQFYCDVPQFSVASGSSYELLIHANLSSEGSQDATLSISSNDPANPSIGINLSATGVPAPQLMLSTSSISLQMDQYAYLPYSLSFSNIGLGDLTISEVQILGMDWLEYQLLGATLLPSEAGSLDLIFNSTGLEVGLYYGQIVLISNDPAQPQTTIQIIVEISPIALVAEFNADPISGYAPLEVSFSSLSYTTDGSQITSWEWDFNDDGIVDSVAENPSFSYSSSGSFAVTLKVTNDAGATHQTRKPDFIFVLNSAPQIAEALEAIQLTEDIPLLDFDLSPYFSDPDGDQLSYTVSESPNLTFSITGSLLSIYPAEDYYGSQQVLIHATDPYSASVSQNVWINVVAENDAPGFVELPPYLEFLRYTDYTVDFSPHVQDVDTDIQLLSISIAGNTNFTWQAQGLSITFSAPGDWFGEEEVTIILNDNFGRSISSETISIRILESLVASFTVSTTDVLAGVPLQFQNTSPGNITHFEWDFDNDSIVDSNEENPVHVYALGGAKSPRLKVMHKVDEDVIHQSEYTFVDGIFVRGTNIPGGNAVGSWVLENAPYNITGAIVVPADSLLSIDPEVQVNIVSEDVSITVRGSLQAESVNFSPISTDRWKGFVIENDVESLSLSNSRVQNAEIPFLIRGNASLSGCVIAKDSLLVFNQESGIAILDAEQVSLQNLDIQNYNTGIQIDSEFTASAPTLSNIRIRSSASAVRTDATGIKLSGQILPLFDNVEIENYSVGILYEGDNASLAAPPTISNVRIRNTSSTIRSLSTGIKILNLREVTVSQDSLSGCSTAIDIQNENPQLVNRPTISNIRIRNTGNTVRTQTTGIKLEGNLLLRMDDVDIEDYNNGISLIGTNNSLLTTPSTISNIRVRNTGNTVRETGIGIYIRDFPRITVINDSIFGYNEGIKLHNSNPALANKPTLSNIRIRNTGNTVRNSGTGISLMPGIFALVSDCLVQDYALGIRVLGTEADIRENRLVDNDLAIHLEQAAPQTRVEYNEILRTIWNDLNPATAISTDRCQDSKLYNNTIYNYGNALAAIGSVLEFKNNIVWAPALLEDIISSNSSTIAVDYNNFRLAEAWPGMGNLTLDPLFINEADLDLNLHYDSPMIDSGDPLLEPDPDGSTRDIGANIYLHKADFESDMRFVSPGQSIQFNNLSWGHPADISSFFWDFDNDGAIDSTIENPNWTPTELGRYDVKLVIQTGSLIDSLLLLNHVLVQTIQLNPPQNLRISVSYPDLQLSWDPVISDVFGDNASPDFYLCYANNAPNGTFRFVGETQGETDWTHSDAATTERMFYVVIGFTGTREDLMNFLGSRGSTIQISPALPPYHQNLKAKTKTP